MIPLRGRVPSGKVPAMQPRSRRWFFAAAAAAALHAHASAAGLEWKSPTVEVSGMRSEKELAGIFEYTNRGDRPVRIVSTRTTCGCTIAKPSRELVAPGESGELRVTYKVASKVGYYEAGIQVFTDDPEQRETKLALRLRVRDEVEMSRKLVLWQEGEPRSPKAVSFLPGDGKPIDRIEPVVSGGGVEARAEPKDGGFDLVLTPVAGAKNARGVVRVKPVRGGKPLDELRLHYRVL
jgi:hypothetical protein